MNRNTERVKTVSLQALMRKSVIKESNCHVWSNATALTCRSMKENCFTSQNYRFVLENLTCAMLDYKNCRNFRLLLHYFSYYPLCFSQLEQRSKMDPLPICSH